MNRQSKKMKKMGKGQGNAIQNILEKIQVLQSEIPFHFASHLNKNCKQPILFTI
jgi:hypothetical protein